VHYGLLLLHTGAQGLQISTIMHGAQQDAHKDQGDSQPQRQHGTVPEGVPARISGCERELLFNAGNNTVTPLATTR